MIESLESLPNVQILQLTGHVGSNLRESPIELARRASLIGGNNAKAIMAPLYVESLQAAQALRNQPDIKEVFDLFDTVTTAIAAVGSFAPAADGGANSQFLPLLPPATQERLLATGAIAEVCGLPFRADGSLADPELTEHIFSISAEQLGRIPRVIAIASDPSKAEATLALWRADMISELVVDVDLAEALLSAPTKLATESGR
jgi:DNA-binding transcriptional regulator LsrR (DeoR family)